jgi:predicted nucleotidyltransferase
MDAEARLPPQARRVVEAIRRRYEPERIILFGSYAWGHPSPDSDVDLFIVKETAERPRERRTRLRSMLQEEKKGLPMDFLVYTPGEVEERLAMADPFVEQILRDGVVLYAA